MSPILLTSSIGEFLMPCCLFFQLIRRNEIPHPTTRKRNSMICYTQLSTNWSSGDIFYTLHHHVAIAIVLCNNITSIIYAQQRIPFVFHYIVLLVTSWIFKYRLARNCVITTPHQAQQYNHFSCLTIRDVYVTMT
jgi:hypothetical protein